ncbi:MAG: dehydrogenase [Hyphomicrobiales bacterium]|nr:dehydrogenase [Hyphomicrobiales bacterium]
MQFVTADDIRRVLTFEKLVTALEAGHRAAKLPVTDVLIGEGDAQYFVRSSGSWELAFGSKLITCFPENPSRSDLPSVQALFVLFDADDGHPRAVLDGTEITYWKTAADSALGARRLARDDVRTLAMVGAGALAPWLVRAHLAVRPSVERVLIWNRTPERSRALVERLVGEGIACEQALDLEAAAQEADLISCATMTQDPLIQGDWLKPGTHLDLVGGWKPDMREADDAAVRRARVFVDSRESAFDGVGDILLPIESGAMTAADVLADHYDLAAGAEGRTSAEDITLFKNAGGAHLDLMTANAILAEMDAKPG